VSEFRRYIVLLFCLLTGCASIPDSYAPPIQRKPLTGTETEGVGHFVNMGEPNSDAYIVRDVTDAVEAGTWRWTRKRPELRFFLESTEHLTFKADFAVAEVTFKETGPVTITVLVNGHLLDSIHLTEHGERHIDKPVPQSFLRAKTFNTVVMEIDKVWVSKEDGAVLGFILTRAGFTQ
jgi:hypothetical protein